MAKSTLAEIHSQVVKYFYAILSGLEPETWVDNNQVFYCPVATFDDAARILQERDTSPSTNKDLKLPFATVTRGSYSKDNDLTRRPFKVKFIDDVNPVGDGTDPVSSFKILGVKILYNLVVYSNTLDNLEKISEALLFAREGGSYREFISEVIPGLKSGFQIVYDELPDLERVPAVTDLLKGQGSIYALRLLFRVDGAIIRSSSEEKRILEAISNIFDLENSDIQYANITVTS